MNDCFHHKEVVEMANPQNISKLCKKRKQINTRRIVGGWFWAALLMSLPVIEASADTATTNITSVNVSVITGNSTPWSIDLKDSTLTLAGGGDQIIFNPSLKLGKALNPANPANPP